MANQNPKGNPNLAEVGKLPSPAKTEVGKFFRDLPKFSKEKVPEELRELFDWVHKLDTKKTDYLLEMKNIYSVLQTLMLPALYEKLAKGESPDRKDLDALRLLKDIMSESHKLKYGDKKVIENIVSVVDIRKHMMKDKIIKVAEVVK